MTPIHLGGFSDNLIWDKKGNDMHRENGIYRHELKYPISRNELEIIKNRICPLMELDGNVGPEGQYNISSLYFDDLYDTCYYEKENGVDPREKFRLRIYNHDISRISLECKRKERGKILKTSCLVSPIQAEKLCHGEYLRDIGNQSPLLRKFTEQMMSRGLRPVIIVEYNRTPFVYKYGNVRVTFDMGLLSSTEVANFLTEQIAKRPIMGTGMQLLEVKYDEYIPDVIYNALQIDNLEQMAFSKYSLCRQHTI